MRESLNNSEGEAARVAATQLDNLKGDMTMLHAALENISVELRQEQPLAARPPPTSVTCCTTSASS